MSAAIYFLQAPVLHRPVERRHTAFHRSVASSVAAPESHLAPVMVCKRKTTAEVKMPSSDSLPDRKTKPEPAPAPAVETPPAPAVSSMVVSSAAVRQREAPSPRASTGTAEEDVAKLLDSDMPKTGLRCDVCHALKLPVFQSKSPPPSPIPESPPPITAPPARHGRCRP